MRDAVGEQQGLPPVRYSPTDAEIAKMQERYAGYVALDALTSEGYEAIRQGLAELRGLRSAIEKRRVELKEDSLKWGRAVDAEAKRITALLTQIETPLKLQKQEADSFEEKRRRLREETIRLAREREERQKREAEEAELAKQHAELERQRQELEEKQRAQREEQERLEAQRKEQERVAKEQREAQEAEERAEREAEETRARAEHEAEEAKQRAQRKAEQEMERQRLEAALRPDVEKVWDYGKRIETSFKRESYPDFNSAAIRADLDKMLAELATAIQRMRNYRK